MFCGARNRRLVTVKIGKNRITACAQAVHTWYTETGKTAWLTQRAVVLRGKGLKCGYAGRAVGPLVNQGSVICGVVVSESLRRVAAGLGGLAGMGRLP